MPGLLRRIRAGLSLATFWGAAAGAIGLVLAVWQATRMSPYPVFPDVGQWWFERRDFVVRFTLSWGAAGALIALGFAGLLGRVEHGQSAATLSPRRLTLWGATAGGGIFTTWWIAMAQLRVPGSLPRVFPVVSLLTAAAFGAGCAWATLRLSRRSDRIEAGERSDQRLPLP